MADLTPQQAIANVLHHTEGEGLNDADAMFLADDVLHALTVAGYAVVAAADLRVALTSATAALDGEETEHGA